MKRSIARKWAAAALESGEYKQTQGTLRQAGRFCCLGVLCNLHAQEHPEIAAKQKLAKVYMGEETELPVEVRDWADMYNSEGRFQEFRLNDVPSARSLICLNDTENYDFKQIAKVIRKHYKEL